MPRKKITRGSRENRDSKERRLIERVFARNMPRSEGAVYLATYYRDRQWHLLFDLHSYRRMGYLGGEGPGALLTYDTLEELLEDLITDRWIRRMPQIEYDYLLRLDRETHGRTTYERFGHPY